MPFSIQFVRGSLAGRRWPAGPDPLLVGRSHACDIRPTESDVSGRHLQFAEADGGIAVTVLSAHRTLVAGSRATQGSVLAAPPGTIVELGDDLAFRVVDDEAAADDTSSLPEQATGTLPGATEGLATAATRFAGEDTGMLDETGTATAATRFGGEETGTFTAATRFGGDAGGETGTVTAATRFGGSADGDETSILGGAATAAGETGESDLGETQVLQTQIASREELEKLKERFEKKRSRKLAVKSFLLGGAAVAALGASIWVSTRDPELDLDRPATDNLRLLPDYAPAHLRDKIRGEVWLEYPTYWNVDERTNSVPLSIHTRIGRNLDVKMEVGVDIFEDVRSLYESRDDSFRRYAERATNLVSAVIQPLGRIETAAGGDEAADIPDFFGGDEGRFRAVPCSSYGYRDLRDGSPVYGVVSFFRYGTLCCAVRREVPLSEKDRAFWLLVSPATYLIDPNGSFSASQWEGATNAGCAKPAEHLTRWKKRLQVDSTSDWRDIEDGLRDILVTTEDNASSADIDTGKGALDALVNLREGKVLRWRALCAERMLLPEPESIGEKARAEALDEAVRKQFNDPSEEWYFLARRENWWEAEP